ncbi:mini-chromosome maintenance complex-binding protein [Thrips palmi]|uniref:Mini-chromosome maintenance complex-binding protein n=1 Tax=Thrips palmi TaxID=161013 RepID=A0A6P9A7U5_THRPL|nr:mini-chromosome maintenance complex-binding protein [Thrips palmi]XP_034254054.1 mini-chromosome maintenance complex-binding protein [Thrips palmi]
MVLRCSLSDWEARPDYFKSLLNETSNWNDIPLINVVPNHELQDHQFVRFRGMVQHMYNPEYFMGKYEVEHNLTKEKQLRSGRYRDIIQCSPEEQLVENLNDAIEERQVLYCITTPALNDWVYEQEKKLCGRQSNNVPSPFKTPNTSTKRQVEDQEPMDVDSAGSSESSASVPYSSGSTHEGKRLSTDESKKGPAISSCSGLSLNFPIDGATGIACIVKIYDSDSSDSLKLNDIIDVVGFLSLNPSLASSSSSLETDAENPPPSLVPRLHAVALQKLMHMNMVPSVFDDVFQSAESMRKELHFVLSQMLLGDSVAADYMLCHLISLVYMRKDGLALGHFSLNLSNLPRRPDYTRLLYSVLQRILPKSHYLPMTLENMNTLSFVPKMDYENNRLSSGLLQLSDNTHLIVDETRLEAGKLDVSGVANVQALRTLISQQIVNYDFQYYTKPYDADIPVLILSEGKSLLPCDVLVPLKADSASLNTLPEIFQAANHFLREPLLSAIRLYLCGMRHSTFEFPEDLQKKAQEDFVAMRQVGGRSVSADDLHLLLVLARLVSLSHGEKVVSLSAWEEAKRMEEERKQRLSNHLAQATQPSNEP